MYVVQGDGRAVQTMTVRSSGTISSGSLTLSTAAWEDEISLDLSKINKVGNVCTVTMNAETDALLEPGVKVIITNFADTDFNKVWTVTTCELCLSKEFTFDCSEHQDSKADHFATSLPGHSHLQKAGSLKYTTNSSTWIGIAEKLETLYLIDDVTVVRSGDADPSAISGTAYSYNTLHIF